MSSTSIPAFFSRQGEKKDSLFGCQTEFLSFSDCHEGGTEASAQACSCSRDSPTAEMTRAYMMHKL